MQLTKLFFGSFTMLLLLVSANAIGQESNASALAARLPQDPNILYAMLAQVLNNPSSMLVIAFLCVFAWLIDDLPFVSSRYVAHYTVIAGAGIYWMFTTAASVPAVFPHPHAVFIANGTLCGFIAFIIHRQAVARIINLFRGEAMHAPLKETSTEAK